MQGVEADVGLQPGENLRQVAAGVDAAHLRAQPLQGVSTVGAGDQAHLPFRRQAAQQDGDMAPGQGAAVRVRHE